MGINFEELYNARKLYVNERLCSVGEHSLSPFKRCPYAVQRM